MKWLILFWSFIAGGVSYAQPKTVAGKLWVTVVPMFNEKKLQLENTRYVNGNGDSLYIDAFRCYLSQFKIGSTIDESIPGGYHLVDASEPASHTFYIKNITPGTYDSLQFIIGVDSFANVAGGLGGDLDPAKGMYWAWNTGYIMAKLEGHAQVCKTLHHEFQFHIGGYLPPYNAARNVTLHLQTPLIIMDGSTSSVTIQANVATWFDGATHVNLAQTNDVVMPCAASVAIANNYAHMFSIQSVQ